MIIQKVDQWVETILVDPLNKDKLDLEQDRNQLRSSYGVCYPIVKNVYDLRVPYHSVLTRQQDWETGQADYERLYNLFDISDKLAFQQEIECFKEIYSKLTISGRLLDIGGGYGQIRILIDSSVAYVSCDPMLNMYDAFLKKRNILDAYPQLTDHFNFICCYAEHLPFKAESFDSAHMRSIVDNLKDADLALKEAYRVLRPNGRLIIGSYVFGGKDGKALHRDKLKESVKQQLARLKLYNKPDHHIWHPTHQNLRDIIASNGFNIEVELWQPGTHDNVCFIQAKKHSY